MRLTLRLLPPGAANGVGKAVEPTLRMSELAVGRSLMDVLLRPENRVTPNKRDRMTTRLPRMPTSSSSVGPASALFFSESSSSADSLSEAEALRVPSESACPRSGPCATAKTAKASIPGSNLSFRPKSCEHLISCLSFIQVRFDTLDDTKAAVTNASQTSHNVTHRQRMQTSQTIYSLILGAESSFASTFHLRPPRKRKNPINRPVWGVR